jgi:hypothetical protein
MASFFDMSDFSRVIDDITKVAQNVQKKEAVAVKLAANEYKTDVQVVIQYITGTLRRSVHVETSMEGAAPVALVGTDAPYARRLEYGFVDTDSLRRVYNQPPAPRWRPTFDNNLEKYKAMIAKALEPGDTL